MKCNIKWVYVTLFIEFSKLYNCIFARYDLHEPKYFSFKLILQHFRDLIRWSAVSEVVSEARNQMFYIKKEHTATHLLVNSKVNQQAIWLWSDPTRTLNGSRSVDHHTLETSICWLATVPLSHVFKVFCTFSPSNSTHFICVYAHRVGSSECEMTIATYSTCTIKWTGVIAYVIGLFCVAFTFCSPEVVWCEINVKMKCVSRSKYVIYIPIGELFT